MTAACSTWGGLGHRFRRYDSPDSEPVCRCGARPPMDQPTLPGGTAPTRAGDPETSRAAAASIGDLTARQAAVLKVLQESELGMTDEELNRWGNLEQSLSGVRTRRSELVRAGLVYDSGRRRRLDSGRLGTVWKVREREETRSHDDLG